MQGQLSIDALLGRIKSIEGHDPLSKYDIVDRAPNTRLDIRRSFDDIFHQCSIALDEFVLRCRCLRKSGDDAFGISLVPTANENMSVACTRVTDMSKGLFQKYPGNTPFVARANASAVPSPIPDVPPTKSAVGR